jgi:hypothetical protein
MSMHNAYKRMTDLQRALAEVLRRANDQKLPAELAVFALARLMRNLLDFMSEDARQMVLEQEVVPFLRHEPVEPSRIITLH